LNVQELFLPLQRLELRVQIVFLLVPLQRQNNEGQSTPQQKRDNEKVFQ
jgi:hypothetical protein